MLSLYSENLGELSGDLVIRSLILSLLFTTILLLGWRVILGHWDPALVLTTSSLLLFYSYGHVYNIFKTLIIFGVSLGRHRILLPIILALFVVWLVWIRRRKEPSRQINQLLRVTGVLLIVFPIYSITSYVLRSNQASTINALQANNSPLSEIIQGEETKPDIFYIILDGYGRQDILEEIYEFDNSSFIEFLEDNGFYVANESQSNYSKTTYSLSSSFNLNYLDTLVDEYNISLSEPKYLIRQSKVRNILEALGYQSVAFDSGYENTIIRDTDYFLHTGAAVNPPAYLSLLINEYELLLLRSTLFRVYYDLRLQNIGLVGNALESQHQKHRERIHYIFQQLEEIPNWEGSYFVFAHIISPHPPFVFGPNGEPRTPRWEFTFQDGSHYPGSQDEYIEGYQSQIEYINKLLMRSITEIINDSEQQPIIILQSDHGPRAFTNISSVENSNLKEAFSILNAYYLPDQEEIGLYPSISPVNSFRLVLNLFFGYDFMLLDDLSYFTTETDTFILVDMTEE